MLEDFEKWVAQGGHKNYDVCIVGGGVAGITLGLELINSDLQVCILEGGGLKYSPDSQEMYQGTWINRIFDGRTEEVSQRTVSDRVRFFGGSSNHWAGRCRRFDMIDFEEREWVKNSGWPITLGDLIPFYKRAENKLELQSDTWEDNDNASIFEKSKIFGKKLYQFSPPVRMGETYGDSLRQAKNITVLLNANVTQIIVDKQGICATSVQVQLKNSNSVEINANCIILATGGVENVRLLLNSNEKFPQGIGNERDIVGRYFMGHPLLKAGAIVSKEVDLSDYHSKFGVNFTEFSSWSIRRLAAKVAIKAGLDVSIPLRKDYKKAQAAISLTDIAQRQHKLLNTAFTVDGYYTLDEMDKIFIDNLFRIRNTMSDNNDYFSKFQAFFLTFRPEQSPKKNSRIFLSHDKDQYGKQKITVSTELSEQDYHSMERVLTLLDEELIKSGSGLIKNDFKLEQLPVDYWGSGHHIGGTRMSTTPQTGVVDRNCRVHGLENLFIAGCSVFPTSGFANPTLTLTALAIRLAEHIKGKYPLDK